MSVFRFKQFNVENTVSAMKVGTDSVLLGASVDVGFAPVRILDIGTGTGVVALMLAQRLSGSGCHIDAIDIDGPSAVEAAANFALSPWKGNLAAYHSSLSDWERNGDVEEYDLIVSNPPFFDNSLQNPDIRIAVARHTASLSYREILSYASRHLTLQGRVSMILPVEDEKSLLRYAGSFSLYPRTLTHIHTVSHKPPKRIVAEFGRQKADPQISELIMQESGEFTAEYRALVSSFLLFL